VTTTAAPSVRRNSSIYSPSDGVYLRRRHARRDRLCGDGVSAYCAQRIGKGHVYLLVTMFNGHQPAGAGRVGTIDRVSSCIYCSGTRGRDYLLHPIPDEQDYRYWDTDSEVLSLAAESKRERGL